jgi:hypothetical protein
MPMLAKNLPAPYLHWRLLRVLNWNLKKDFFERIFLCHCVQCVGFWKEKMNRGFVLNHLKNTNLMPKSVRSIG